MKFIVYILSLFLAGQHIAQAKKSLGACAISVNREACPGKETEAWLPYNGVNPTSHEIPVKDQAGCLAIATQATKIARKGVLKKITASGSYAGTPFSPVSSTESCESSSANKTPNKPTKLSKGVVFQGAPVKK